MRTSKFPLGLLVAVVMVAGVVGLFLSHTSAQQTRVIHLAQGWNSVAWTGEKQSASEALANLGDAVLVVYGYNNDSQSFTRYIVGRPQMSTLTDFELGQAYWVLAQRPADWSVPVPVEPSCPTVTPCPDCGQWQSLAEECAVDYGQCVDAYGECVDDYGECVDDYGTCVDELGCFMDCRIGLGWCVLYAPDLMSAWDCLSIWDCMDCFES